MLKVLARGQNENSLHWKWWRPLAAAGAATQLSAVPRDGFTKCSKRVESGPLQHVTAV